MAHALGSMKEVLMQEARKVSYATTTAQCYVPPPEQVVQPGDKSRISAEPQLRWDNRLSEWVPAVPGAQPRCHSAVTNALSKTNWVFQHKLAPPEKPFVTVYKSDMSPGSLASAQPLTALGGMGPAAAGMAPDAKASAPATWCGFPTADIISDPNSNNKLRFSGKNGSHLQLRDNSSAPTFLTTKTVATDSVNRIFNQDRLWRRPPSKLDMSKKWTAVSVEGPAWMKVPAVEARPESRPKHTHFWNV